MEDISFITIHRKILNWEWWDNHDTFRVFFYFLLKANYIDKKWQGIDVKRGQFISSYDKITKVAGLSTQRTRSAINRLKSTGEITSQSNNRYSLITVINYDEYQQFNKPDNKRITNEQQTDNKRITTTNKINKENKETTKTVSKKKKVTKYLGETSELFEFFKTINQTPQLKLTTTKKTQIAARLKTFSVEEIKQAIEIRSKDPWYLGSNNEGKLWHKDWDSLFRNDEKIDKMLNTTVLSGNRGGAKKVYSAVYGDD